MKKFLVLGVVLFAVLAMSSASFADAVTANLGGCGLGSRYWKGSDTLLAQFSAASTNTSSSNISGITSGTQGCQPFKGIVFNTKVESFVASNMENLANDIAKGNGEYLTTLATLLEVDSTQRAAFNAALQKNFSNIYTSDKVTSEEVMINIKKALNS